MKNRFLKLTTLSFLVSSSIYASGYKVPETSVGAVALSAATVAHSSGVDSAYYNPANLSFLEDGNILETDLILIAIDASKFTDKDGKSIKSESELPLIPAIHYTSKKFGDFRFGLSTTVPSGVTKKGLYIFEYQEWNYTDLKDSKISKASKQKPAKNTLSFENKHDFIKTKFNELIHSDGVDIFNCLIMPNLDSKEYDKLDSNFKKLLPHNNIIFNNTTKNEISNKLYLIARENKKLPNIENIIGNLLIQYLIIDQNKPPYLATKEQISFIDKDIDTQFILKATKASGKTSSILLKAILEKLKNPKIEIVIIKTTRLACDKLKQRLINTIEKAIVEIDLTSIKIITPNDVVNKHLTKLKKPNLEATLYIDSKLMKKKLNIADLILCDDVDLLSVEFIDYLKHIQKNKPLVLVQNYIEKSDDFLCLTKDFRKKNRKIIFKQTNQLAKALQLIAELLKNNNPKDILVVSDKVNKKRLNEDLEHFIKEKAILLNSSDSLINQKLDSFILSSYSEISGLESKFVILLDIEDSPPNEVEYAINLSTDISYILFQNDSSEIKNLKVKYENN